MQASSGSARRVIRSPPTLSLQTLRHTALHTQSPCPKTTYFTNREGGQAQAEGNSCPGPGGAEAFGQRLQAAG